MSRSTAAKSSTVIAETLLPYEIERLHQPPHFIAMWFKMCGRHATHEKAYEAVEEIYSSHYKRNRYKNYESFRRSMKHHVSRGNVQ
jgi:hypothetical protein